MSDQWISVRNWRRFQHYQGGTRTPPWIKNYTDLMADQDYLNLSLRLRGVLHGLWVAYAESRCKLGASPANLRLILGDSTVRARDIEALNQAGFIDIVDSAALANGYHLARARKTAAEELRTPKGPTEANYADPTPEQPAAAEPQNPEPPLRSRAEEVARTLTGEADREGTAILTDLALRVTSHDFEHLVARITNNGKVSNPAGWLRTRLEANIRAQQRAEAEAQHHRAETAQQRDPIERMPIRAVIELQVKQLAEHGHSWEQIHAFVLEIAEHEPNRDELVELATRTYAST